VIKSRKNKGLFALYGIYIMIIIIITIPALTFFLGVNWFCTESIYIIYLGGVSFVNTLYVVLKSGGFALAILLTLIINKKVLFITKDYDSKLEQNVIDLITAYISYFWLDKKHPNIAIVILILLSFWEIVIVKTTIDNLIDLVKFVEKGNNV